MPSKAESPVAAINRPLPHYKLGDLGIVPPPKPKLGQRLGAASPSLGPVQSRRTRSIGVQTVSAQKVSCQRSGSFMASNRLQKGWETLQNFGIFMNFALKLKIMPFATLPCSPNQR